MDLSDYFSNHPLNDEPKKEPKPPDLLDLVIKTDPFLNDPNYNFIGNAGKLIAKDGTEITYVVISQYGEVALTWVADWRQFHVMDRRKR